jgi:hypothetical protein
MVEAFEKSGRPMRGLVVGACLLAAGCSSGPKTTLSLNPHGIPPGQGRVAGRVGPGAPPNGTVPTLVLTFTTGSVTVSVTAPHGVYQVDLAPGTWSVRSDDGKACATGLRVTAGGASRDDLIYPTFSCQDLSGPPNPPPPAGP